MARAYSGTDKGNNSSYCCRRNGGVPEVADKSITVDDVANSLIAVGVRLDVVWRAQGWNTENNGQTSHWMSASMSLADVKGELDFAADRVRLANRGFSDEQRKFLGWLKRRADELSVQNLSSGPDAIFGAILELVNSVFRHVPPPAAPPPPPPPPKVDWEDLKTQDLVPKDLARRLRSVDAKLKDFAPRTDALEKQITFIEGAREAADQLPIDMEELRAKKDELRLLVAEAEAMSAEVQSARTRVEDAWERIEKSEIDTKESMSKIRGTAEDMIKRSEQALRGATSVGLANAFEARRKTLADNGMLWTVGLIVALCSAVFVGWERLGSLQAVLSGDKSASVVWANVLLALFGVGAPVWFAWLATKQIGTTFRLAEDYAFKASVSQAYEGYRTEAVQIDPVLRERLFETALSRIEEAPIRLVDGPTHSSPLGELLSNPSILKGLEAVPDIYNKIIAFIPAKGGAAAAAIVAPAAAAGALANAVVSSDTAAQDREVTDER
jgi:hypothetical protein